MNLVEAIVNILTRRPPPLREPRLPSVEEGRSIDARQREQARELAVLRRIVADGDVFHQQRREYDP